MKIKIVVDLQTSVFNFRNAQIVNLTPLLLVLPG